MSDYQAKFIIAAENRVKDATKDAEKDFEGFGDRVKSALSSITVTAGDVMSAVKGIANTVTEWVNTYAQDERAMITLQTALEATGQAAGEDTVGRLTRFASSLQAITGIGDETTNALSARLIANGKSVDETMKLIKAAADYSAATGESFEATVDALEKTFSGTAGRISGFVPELKDLSKEELESGAAIDVVVQKYGGFTEKLADTASVSVATFTAAMGDVKEALGGAIMPAVQPILESFTKFLVETVIPAVQSFAPIVKTVFEEVASFIEAFRPIVEPILNWFGDVWKTTIGPNIENIWNIVKNVLGLISAAISGDWAKAWESAKAIVQNAVDLIKRPFDQLVTFVKSVWDGVKTSWDKTWAALKDAVKKPIDAILAFFQPVIDAVTKVVNGVNAAVSFIAGEKRVGNSLVDKNNKIVGEYITVNGVETLKRYASGTGGAAPGWALVGEEGPELVLFSGGEEVIPNHKLYGYAQGTKRDDDVDTEVGVEYVNSKLSVIVNGIASAAGKLVTSFSDVVTGLTSITTISTVFTAVGNTISSIGKLAEPFIKAMKEIGSIKNIIDAGQTIINSFIKTITPTIDTLMTPLLNILQILGQTLGQLVLPFLEALAPVIEFVGKAFVWLYNNIIMPVGNLIYKIFAGIWNWVAGIINGLFGWLGLKVNTVDTSVQLLKEIDYSAVQPADASETATSAGQTAAQSASYKTQSITINIYQEAPVVGSGGMTEFARMIRTEFDRLAYYGA